MRPHLSAVGRSILLLGSALLPLSGEAQLISLKTVPVAAGDQFLIFPSENLGMGGVTIALDDRSLDPFVNPARGARRGESRFFATPTFYGISENNGNARTLPVGAFMGSDKWFGAAVFAVQQLQTGDNQVFPLPLADLGIVPSNALSERSATNQYAFASLGRRFGGGRVAVGASAMLADLNAVDGVEHMYALSSAIDQFGHVEDYRLGLTTQWAGDRSLEVVVLHNRFDMTHDVTYVDWVLTDSTVWIWEQRVRVETNLDKTRTWGMHLGYVQPIGSSAWRIGGILTVNRKSHPKIPNYELMNIPRDPGTSWAYNLGVGASKTEGPTTFAVDFIYEPAVSHTWAEALEDVPSASGRVIGAGDKTIENRFNFSNTTIRLGVARTIDIATLQLGLQVRSFDYTLRQQDHVAVTNRRQDEQWMEWTPSWGASFAFADLEVRYVGRVLTGTGRPGVAWNGGVADRFESAGAANDIVIAPGGPLTLQNARVLTHQVGIAIPIR